MKVEWVRAGDLLELQRRRVDVIPGQTYLEIGVRSFGNGLFVKEPRLGLDLGTKRVFRVRSGDLVVSNVFAWEGAVARAGAAHDGLIGSHRFMTWTLRDERADLRFVTDFFRSARGVGELRKASPGSAGRNRTLSISGFEQIMVPLPRRSEQESIATHLDSIARASTRFDGDSGLRLDLSGPTYRVGELLRPVTRVVPIQPEALYALSGVKWYGAGLFERERKQGREIAATSLRRIRAGDLVYNRLFAWKQSFALAAQDGWASNEFPTFEINTKLVRPRVLLACLLTQAFTDAVNGASTGSTPTSRNRLKEESFLSLSIEVPARERQGSIERGLGYLDRVRELAARRDQLAAALLPAARNEIFNAMR